MRALTAKERNASPAPATCWRQGTIPWTWCVAAVLLAAVPLLYPQVPPLTDLPAHMSRFMVQMDDGRSADLARWYTFSWNLLPNLGTDLLAFVLEPILGLSATMKTIAILIVVLQSAGYLVLSRVAHGRVTATALFAVPLAFGQPFQFGFLNFTLAIALTTLALALWISPWMTARPGRRWLTFCLVASIVWICHLAGWAVLCITIGCCEFAARFESNRRFWHSAFTGFIASSCLLVPQALSLLWPRTPEHLPTDGWFLLTAKVAFIASVLADRWSSFDTLCIIELIVLIVCTWRSRAFALHKGLALTACVLFGIFWFMPNRIYGSYYADMRMLPMVFALALIAVRPSKPANKYGWLSLTAVAFVAVRLAGNTASLAMWDEQIRQETEVLNHLPRGSQLVTLTAMPCKLNILQGPARNTHIASYALMRRHAFANDQYAMSGGQLLRISNPAAAPFDRDPSSRDIGEECQGTIPVLTSAAEVPSAIPYLWIVWQSGRVLPVPGWTPLARSGANGHSVLYQRSSQ